MLGIRKSKILGNQKEKNSKIPKKKEKRKNSKREKFVEIKNTKQS